jgi:para-nitrobenzyl esterase
VASGVAEGFAAGRQARIPLIVGGNSNEASLFRPNPAQLDALTEDRRAAILAAYDPAGGGDRTRIVNQVVTDTFVTEPDRNLARLQARAGGQVWLYYFGFVPAAERAASQGARHTAEIRYVFGGPRQRLSAEEAPLSKAMNAYWAAFATSGDPDSAGGARWPRFEPDREPSMVFDEAGPHVVDHQFKARLDVVEQGQ